MSQEILGKDINGAIDYTLPVPTVNACWNQLLTANTVATITVPPNFNRAFFVGQPGANFWVTYDGSNPVVPSTGAFSSQEYLPGGRQISITGTQQIKMISDTAPQISIRFI